jgi:hypothetical protein
VPLAALRGPREPRRACSAAAKATESRVGAQLGARRAGSSRRNAGDVRRRASRAVERSRTAHEPAVVEDLGEVGARDRGSARTLARRCVVRERRRHDEPGAAIAQRAVNAARAAPHASAARCGRLTLTDGAAGPSPRSAAAACSAAPRR